MEPYNHSTYHRTTVVLLEPQAVQDQLLDGAAQVQRAAQDKQRLAQMVAVQLHQQVVEMVAMVARERLELVVQGGQLGCQQRQLVDWLGSQKPCGLGSYP